MEEKIVNKVANSGLITIDLEDYFKNIEKTTFDISKNLWQGIALKEADFRAFIKVNDWSLYKNKYVNIECSTEAIVPSWAYILVALALEPYVAKAIFGSQQDLEKEILVQIIESLPYENYMDGKIIIKGCSNIPFPEFALVLLSQKLKPIVKSLMYGEPCSTVPIYKKPKNEG